jgi:hypothetical protein
MLWRETKSVTTYVQRWRDKVAHVQPLLIETEMEMLFANTFQSLYYEYLMGSSTQYFYDTVRIVKRIWVSYWYGKN